MKLLLDTHTFLWWCADSQRLSETARRAISAKSNDVLVSAVNGWEIAIKARLGRLRLSEKPSTFMARMLALHAFKVLPVTMAHAVAEYDLPEHHHDPFDRLLIAQAKSEGALLATNDEIVKRYEVMTLW
ncbi:MAG: type II toxin-antitoxin system VapC family toxin [Trueperaceae bacterium]